MTSTRVGVCSWSLDPPDPQQLVDALQRFDICSVQLALEETKDSLRLELDAYEATGELPGSEAFRAHLIPGLIANLVGYGKMEMTTALVVAWPTAIALLPQAMPCWQPARATRLP